MSDSNCTKDVNTTEPVTDPAPASTESAPVSTESAPASAPAQINLLEVDITDEHVALNVIVGFLGVAQRRGVFAMNESAKIFECVNMFQQRKQ